jgi:hypothetical protein
MNERIKELLKKATRRVDRDDREWVFSEVDQKKFAELIIRECANRASWAQDTGAKDIGGEVLKHFGVEE